MTLFLLLSLTFFTVALISLQIIPALYNRTVVISERRQQKFSNNMEQLMSSSEASRLSRIFIFSPLILGLGLFMLAPDELKFVGLIVGLISGVVFPGIYIRTLTRRLKDKFTSQLVDALMIMSSSFRGGLSLIQAFEAVVDEMPDPIRKDFAIVLGENKMGVSLEEALNHLYNRTPSTALQQMITAILLARETGGNLPVIFSRIVNNIRESRKIQQNLDTLTLQGKIQGSVMTLLPIGFGFVMYSTNRRMFDHMLASEVGRGLLIYAAISWVIGAYMVWKISSFKDF